jgi:tetratricopeptide (TPR) repeat protein
MKRTIFVAAVLLSAVFIVGCQKVLKNDAHFKIDPSASAVISSEGFAVPGAMEVDLVEQMATHRNAYRAALERLLGYYSATGNVAKRDWAERELELTQYYYLMAGEIAGADLRATDSIAEADELYDSGNRFYELAGGGILIIHDDNARAALRKLNKLIDLYPTSDKIDDAAFKAGRVYEHFGDYDIAAVYYQRTFQWDDATPYPGRFRAAYMLDRRLRMRTEALDMYRLAYEKESRFEANTKYASKRISQLTKPKDEPQAETSESKVETEKESLE